MEFWTENEVAVLKTLLRQGLAASKIAAMMSVGGRQFSRNAIISKIDRMGLRDDLPPRVRSERQSQLARQTNRAKAGGSLKPKKPPPLKLDHPVRGPNAIPFVLRRLDQCPYPIEGQGASMIVCGEPVSHGSWCESCAVNFVYSKRDAA